MFTEGENILAPTIQPFLFNKEKERDNISGKISSVLDHLAKIPLEEMTQVKLMDRLDTKYIIPVAVIPELISTAAPFYKTQTIGDITIASYETLYFDTPACYFYHSHLNGKLNRFKIRIRNYVDTRQSFLEIKQKSNKGRTCKKRISHPYHLNFITETDREFILNETGNSTSIPQNPLLFNSFSRITLVNHAFTERLTIDFGLTFVNPKDQKKLGLPKVAIIELKQNKETSSELKKILLEKRIRKTGLSKYCLGMSLLHDNVKNNRYKQKIRQLNKLTHHEYTI